MGFSKTGPVLMNHGFIVRGFLSLLLMTLMIGCQSLSPETKALLVKMNNQTLYTAYNIWYEKPWRVYSINYKRGAILPAGSKISNLSISSRRISFTANNIKFKISFMARYHPGQSTETYLKKMLTEKDFNGLTAGMSEKEIDAVKRGAVIVGMSKEEVLVTYGYPPEHRTPVLKSNLWLYWRNRIWTKKICFDQNQETTRDCVAEDPFLPPTDRKTPNYKTALLDAGPFPALSTGSLGEWRGA